MTRFDVARTQQPKSTAAYGSLRFGPLRYQLKRTIGMLPTPDNSECSRQCALSGVGKIALKRMAQKVCMTVALASWPTTVFQPIQLWRC
ncbi:hypothetical protein [Tateyamaria sp.]|uniref:hypothetical protein n=1 Tax=Tateyamaria sp. TaxID=1929288 RepID=UPI003B21507B